MPSLLQPSGPRTIGVAPHFDVVPRSRTPPLASSTGKTDAKAAATKAAKAVKKGLFKRTRKPRFSVVFHRPKTQIRKRAPKYIKKR